MRRWLDSHAGGSPPWPAHMRGAAPLLANLDLEPPQVRVFLCLCAAAVVTCEFSVVLH